MLANVTNPFNRYATFSSSLTIDNGTQIPLNYSVQFIPNETKQLSIPLSDDLIQEELSTDEQTETLQVSAVLDSEIVDLPIYFPEKVLQVEYVGSDNSQEVTLLATPCSECEVNETLFIVPSLPATVRYFKPQLAAHSPTGAKSAGSSQASMGFVSEEESEQSVDESFEGSSPFEGLVYNLPSEPNSTNENTSISNVSKATGLVTGGFTSFVFIWFLIPVFLIVILLYYSLGRVLVLKIVYGKNCWVLIFNHSSSKTTGVLKEFTAAPVILDSVQTISSSIIGNCILIPFSLVGFAFRVYSHEFSVLARATVQVNERKKVHCYLLNF
ncbi:MAG: hypothetical protein Q7K43_02740 [Candidatus Woesearchaeota archaeon]|nr:hypothetical protein [Candidatus Woesearchaeota archaeon]